MNPSTAIQPYIIAPAPAIPAAPRSVHMFPSRAGALEYVNDHIARLRSTRKTPEQHTKNNYELILKRFLTWLDDTHYAIPTEQAINAYVAELANNGLAASTVNVHLAAIKRLCRGYARQPIEPALPEQERFLYGEWRQSITNALEVRGIPEDKKSNQARLDQFHWRNEHELKKIAHAIPRNNLPGRRDYALFVLAINSALRVAELSRVSLASFRVHSNDTVLISNLRGKGGIYDPIPVPGYVRDILLDYVNAYNGALPAGDPRRIRENDPIWRPFAPYHNTIPHDARRASVPLSAKAIASIIKRRSQAAGLPMCGHDTRRSVIAYLRAKGFSHSDIRKVSRHQDLNTVVLYAGEETNYDDFNHFLRTGEILA